MSFAAHESGAKKLDYWWTVLFTDPIALRLSHFLARKRWLTPDQVTFIALVLGLSVGVFFSLGDRLWLAIGGGVFYLAFIVDCVDGKLARALGVTSERGKALDALADGGRRASASIGLTFGIWNSDALLNELVLVAVLYVSLAYYFLEISGAVKDESGGGMRGKWSAALARRRLLPNPGMPDVQAIVFILGPLTGFVVPALWVGIAMVVVAILLTVRRRLRAAS